MDDQAQPGLQNPVRKPGRIRWLAGILIILLIATPVAAYAWMCLANPCEVNAVQDASVFLVTQLKTYDRVYQVAVTASRAAPDHPVNTLKQIFMDTQQLPVPACLQTAKDGLLRYMGTVISAFQAFQEGEADAAILDLIKQSEAQYANFNAELKAINECAPFCMP